MVLERGSGVHRVEGLEGLLQAVLGLVAGLPRAQVHTLSDPPTSKDQTLGFRV